MTIRERKEYIGRISSIDCTFVEELSSYWKLQVGESSEKYFDNRLLWSNIQQEDVPKLLGKIKSFDAAGIDFPHWIYLFDDFLAGCKIEQTKPKYKNKTIPFYDVIEPLVCYFVSKLDQRPESFSDKAMTELEESLFSAFSKISAQSFLEEFDSSGDTYGEFTRYTKENKYRDFFTKYSYLARLIFVRGDFWVSNTNFLFSALEQDIEDIIKKFGYAKSLNVLHINTDLSESHNGGKNVYILITNMGNVVFKYRYTEVEQEVFSFLNYLNNELRIDNYVPWMLMHDQYCWMEYIPQERCKDTNEVKEYYERIGSLLATFYLLSATDLHYENMISRGEYPVFIDLETVMVPVTMLNNEHINKLNEHIDQTYGLSVSRIGILPQWLLGADTSVYNNSALGVGKKNVKYPAMAWKNVNENLMHYEYVSSEVPEGRNLVYLGDTVQQPSDYTADVIKGFVDVYDFFQTKKNDPLFVSYIRNLSNKRTRFVFRATKVYTLLLEYLNHPDFMRDGVARSLELEVLAKGLLVDLSKKHIFWEIMEDELTQLESNDIPYYVSNSNDTTAISLKGTKFRNVFRFSGFYQLEKAVFDLSEEDKNFQLHIIKGSMNTDEKRDVQTISNFYNRDLKYNVDTSEIVDLVVNIGSRISESRITVDGRSTWVSYVSNIVSHTYGYKPIGLDTANGNMGVAIFLGALYKYTDDNRYLEILEQVTAPLNDTLNEVWSRNEFIQRFGTGGTTGAGSVIYAFTKLYEFTEDIYFLIQAQRFVKLIDTEVIDRSIRQDVITGNAGLLLALVKLYEVSPSPETRNLMTHCYKQIANTGFVDDTFINWDYQQNKKLLGFSHGSSGILYSLSRYIRHSNEKSDINTLIDKILTYEETHYDNILKNWPDYRYDIPDLNIVSWCHGAIGVGMSRMELLQIKHRNPCVKADIKNSAEKMLTTGEHSLDTLCCGNSGRLDFTLQLSQSEFQSTAIDLYKDFLVSNMKTRYEQTGDFNYFSKFNTEDVNIGLYQGISGIGYELLRYLDPCAFKSILLFQ